MPISPMFNSSESATLSQLVTLLTRPLALVYPAQAVVQLQILLHTNLVCIHHPISPFTLLLSPACLPPTPIYAACLQAGIAWPEWIRALGNQVMYIFVMEGGLTLRVGESGEPITLWSEDPVQVPPISKTKTGVPRPILSKLRDMLAARERVSAALESSPIVLPILISFPTQTDDDDTISESDSDTESTTSSTRFSEASSDESMTSVSSTSSSPISAPCDLPAVQSVLPKKTSVYVPPSRMASAKDNSDFLKTNSISSVNLLPCAQRRLAPVTVDKTKASVCRYTYQGGQTGVMTGGVMLGKVHPSSAVGQAPTVKPAPICAPLRRSPRKHAGAIMLGPDSSNWRRVRA
ncbi:hypothetical protein BDP27DRAFT_1334001 [Rhodocollybia butyracea]|uniref:Uncharacterized protein n=1 Tax=Rhodocollybia butyracea TaxID=206335 RepID=A0A9P5U2R7_9AGAR|nr:hypothetical protein BDP27DRAFT_1334001 [Rhodocollybia butyracea]